MTSGGTKGRPVLAVSMLASVDIVCVPHSAAVSSHSVDSVSFLKQFKITATLYKLQK